MTAKVIQSKQSKIIVVNSKPEEDLEKNSYYLVTDSRGGVSDIYYVNADQEKFLIGGSYKNRERLITKLKNIMLNENNAQLEKELNEFDKHHKPILEYIGVHRRRN